MTRTLRRFDILTVVLLGIFLIVIFAGILTLSSALVAVGRIVLAAAIVVLVMRAAVALRRNRVADLKVDLNAYTPMEALGTSTAAGLSLLLIFFAALEMAQGSGFNLFEWGGGLVGLGAVVNRIIDRPWLDSLGEGIVD